MRRRGRGPEARPQGGGRGGASVDVTGKLRRGDPAETVVTYAEEVDADLLVLGTRHRSEEYRALLGNVTDQVLRLTARLAVVVKTDVDE
ncbi:universal stress protein [Halarchaeum acidiphilum MH1-52-1]|uniref:Universal stress protein n=1 Tax=Halarchaeum acidiphilum MH1-52-1 TaxID=1261545 RepID=U3AC96_9EURY|nr:universal stress protein [Halarchaeum acidiphilum MH1-52-1]